MMRLRPRDGRRLAVSLFLLLLCCLPGTAQRGRSSITYSDYVRQFGDTIIEHGRDMHGPAETPLWAGVINAQDLTVPRDGVPAPPGVREGDRAVGGCNLYHDVVTLRVFRVLSAVLHEPRYAGAARDYMSFYLANVRSPETGFLAWGEHLYYDLYRDEVAAERKWHELLEWTPPWPELWEVNPGAVTAAIEALRFHYHADDPASLFNRHAFFARPEFQPPGGQPWIKHSGLFAYSFMFLYNQTQDKKWLAWSRAAADLYWNHRNPDTNLTLSCIGDPREQAKAASTGQAMLAYWLLKTYQLNPRETQIWKQAVTLFKAYDARAYNQDLDAYHGFIHVDGLPLDGEMVQPWHFAYGAPSILPLGRMAAYFARTEKDPQFLEIAKRVARLAKSAPLPDQVSIQGIGAALNLSLDLYDLTESAQYLADAKHYADIAIQRFWVANPSGGLFVRLPGDSFYEAKVGTGDLLAGLMRLHIHTNRYARDPNLYDWTF